MSANAANSALETQAGVAGVLRLELVGACDGPIRHIRETHFPRLFGENISNTSFSRFAPYRLSVLGCYLPEEPGHRTSAANLISAAIMVQGWLGQALWSSACCAVLYLTVRSVETATHVFQAGYDGLYSSSRKLCLAFLAIGASVSASSMAHSISKCTSSCGWTPGRKASGFYERALFRLTHNHPNYYVALRNPVSKSRLICGEAALLDWAGEVGVRG